MLLRTGSLADWALMDDDESLGTVRCDELEHKNVILVFIGFEVFWNFTLILPAPKCEGNKIIFKNHQGLDKAAH